MIKTDCVNFEYEQDMGKSIPSCRISKRKTTACLCDTGSNYIDDCGDCDRYVRKDYGFLKSVVKTLPEPYQKGGAE